MAERLLKVKGTQLYYEDFSEVAHLLTGAVVEGSFDGNLKVKGTYLHYMDDNDAQRRLLGTLTGETLAAGRIKNKGDYLYYGDINDAERWLAPVTIFYSDPHPEVTSVDGLVKRVWPLVYPDPQTWAELRGGAGTIVADAGTLFTLDLRAGSNAGEWYWLSRVICLFDTSVIDPGHTILEASLSIKFSAPLNNFSLKPSLGVYASNPASDTGLVMADYSTFSDTLLSSTIPFDDIVSPWVHIPMVFIQAGLDAINKGGITKLGIRDATRDGPNTPHWEEDKYYQIHFHSTETVLDADRPYLTVKYV